MKWSWKLIQVLSLAGSLFQKRKSKWEIFASCRMVVAMLMRCSSDSWVPKAADMSLKVRKRVNMWARGLEWSYFWSWAAVLAFAMERAVMLP